MVARMRRAERREQETRRKLALILAEVQGRARPAQGARSGSLAAAPDAPPPLPARLRARAEASPDRGSAGRSRGFETLPASLECVDNECWTALGSAACTNHIKWAKCASDP